jgi:hypothetical protein
MRNKEMYMTFWSGNFKRGNHLGELDMDGRIIQWISEKYVVKM